VTSCDSVAMASAQVRGVLSHGPIVVSRQESTPAFSNPAPIADPKRHSQDFVVGVRLERFDASVSVRPMGSLSCLDERLFDSSVAVASIQLAFR
jgi:hypothetical protein